MATKKKLLQAAAGQAGGAGGLNVEEVFSTYLYTGNNTANRVINNGIDLAGEGGIVWTRIRYPAGDHSLWTTDIGAGYRLLPNETNAKITDGGLTSFNNNGFTIQNNSSTNPNNNTMASWTFRKAPKFFDVQTFTAQSSGTQTINHNLGSAPGSIILKSTSNADNWVVYHKELSSTQYLTLNTTNAVATQSNMWPSVTSTSFDVSIGNTVTAGRTYVAYLFAHNDGDGEFGPDGDADIIKCGSYTGTGSDGNSISLGFEPQWVLVKKTNEAYDWTIFDNMRGVVNGGNDQFLHPNLSDAEDSPTNAIHFDADGFTVNGGFAWTNDINDTYIYIAIRRGPMAVPESADEVFETKLRTGTGSAASYDTSFPTDIMLHLWRNTGEHTIFDRVRGNRRTLGTRLTGAENTVYNDSDPQVDFVGQSTQTEINWPGQDWNNTNSTIALHFWKRAPNFFDVVAYTGNGTAGRTVSHNLGVAPEMMWVKRRDSIGDWRVYHSGLDATAPQDKYINLNEDLGVSDSTLFWNDTAPTDSNFTLGSHATVNGSGGTYIAYLFASLDGVSKLGTISFTNGSTSSVDCGFSSGARFVLLKSTSATGGWWVFDTERGIVSGNDPYLQLNSTTAENSSFDIIDPLSSGFQLSGNTLPSDTYIFYAVA